jgi:hypothetical protein
MRHVPLHLTRHKAATLLILLTAVFTVNACTAAIYCSSARHFTTASAAHDKDACSYCTESLSHLFIQSD